MESFGSGGYGLEVKNHTPDCAYFEGAGGRIEVVTCAEEKGASVDMVSQEWDYQVKEFIRKIR